MVWIFSGVCAAISTPAENPLPSLLRTITEISVRCSISASARDNSSIIEMSITFSGALSRAIRATTEWISTFSRASLDSAKSITIPSPLGRNETSLQIDRRLPHFANGRQGIARTDFLGNPFLFVRNNFEQKLLVRLRWHVIFQMLVISPIVQQLARLRMELLSFPASNFTVELDVRRVKLWLARLKRIVEALNQTSHFIAIQSPVVVVQVIKVRRMFIFRLVVTSLHPPNVRPVCG